MDPDDGLEEDEPLFPWLPPDDRLWRHPSEVASGRADSAFGAGAGSAPTSSASSAIGATSESAHPSGIASAAVRSGTGLAVRELDRRLWSVALLAGVVGALLASGAGVVAGQYHRTVTVVRPIEHVVDPGTPYLTIASTPKSDDPTVDMIANIAPTIVDLLVTGNGVNGSGSGVIFTDNGYILTNEHVVDGAQSVTAVMSDGRRVNCRFVGADAATDLAVVLMENSKPQLVARLGTSKQLKAGQLAIAIGSDTFGTHSVTRGIISAMNKKVTAMNGPSLIDMIQTTAPIEPGSSGGALVDANGNVVGITTAVANGDQSMQSLGFATPIELANDVATQIMSTGKVRHAWLGIQGTDVDLATAKALGVRAGALVQSVDSHSPASRLGLTASDVITSFGSQSIDSMSGLEISVRRHRPGDRVEITFIHDGDIHSAEAVLLERPAPD